MSFIWEASPLWRKIVRETRDSKPLFLVFILGTTAASTLAWYCSERFTNPTMTEEQKKEITNRLRKKSGLDSQIVSEVNKTRLKELLREVSMKDGTSTEKQEKRWRDALDGRTTGDKDGTTKRHFGW